MKAQDQYLKFVRWEEADQLYVGYCPDLFPWGGVCHGAAEEEAYRQLCALVAGGGYAEYCLAPAGTCLPVPKALTLVDAAAMPETLFTVWVNLFERGFAADGDWVIVHGGTSGIGTMAIALGKLFSYQVVVLALSCEAEQASRRR